jgi:hypothetical protein
MEEEPSHLVILELDPAQVQPGNPNDYSTDGA